MCITSCSFPTRSIRTSKSTKKKDIPLTLSFRALLTEGGTESLQLTIALCSDIGPLFRALSGAGMSDVSRFPALCLKVDFEAMVQFH
jgi:hypothetical protein